MEAGLANIMAGHYEAWTRTEEGGDIVGAAALGVAENKFPTRTFSAGFTAGWGLGLAANLARVVNAVGSKEIDSLGLLALANQWEADARNLMANHKRSPTLFLFAVPRAQELDICAAALKTLVRNLEGLATMAEDGAQVGEALWQRASATHAYFDSTGMRLVVGDRVWFRGAVYTIADFTPTNGAGPASIQFREPPQTDEVAYEFTVDKAEVGDGS